MPLNHNLQKLFEIAKKDERLAIGLMSGTSLDGLDIALCRIKGSGMQTRITLVNLTTIAYPEAFKNEVTQVFAKQQADMEKLCLLNAHIGSYHAELIVQALKDWNIAPSEVDFIASHGQTVYHAPARQHKYKGYGNATLQIGDADHIAVTTGILTISDFRQKHIAAGGEGAPLALYGDVLLGSRQGEPRILLNIGGIANLTWLPGDQHLSKVLCTDVGPGNTLIDAACKKYFNKPFDAGGEIAFAGVANEKLLAALSSNPFFTQDLPKTTGPEVFNLHYVEQAQQTSDTLDIDIKDLLATLTVLTGKIIVDFIKANFGNEDIKLFVSGGGASNRFIMEYLKRELPGISVTDTSGMGINPDAKEAILFALLGNEALVGQPLNVGNNPAVLMGKFSFAG
ncbi:anhydro-N-acetylmuramic acid kinase [Mucilaginibacter hurinus]|uniref:Anhydro-N-acetylmuramic acid kinase n=2 Tax=Mucilaginibacter hurinus TaxID=2201324 RepID=A0A367GPU6_9SPHI|nr:anhydro-N-acetylmuramic acid kinase [Mucilaginibacter hurinus]